MDGVAVAARAGMAFGPDYLTAERTHWPARGDHAGDPPRQHPRLTAAELTAQTRPLDFVCGLVVGLDDEEVVGFCITQRDLADAEVNAKDGAKCIWLMIGLGAGQGGVKALTRLRQVIANAR